MTTPDLIPEPRSRGLATPGPRELAIDAASGWTDFMEAVKDVDLDGPARNTKSPARAIIAKVGAWPEGRQLQGIADDALAGNTGVVDQDAIDARVEAAHAGDSRAELFAGLERARDGVLEWVNGTAADLPPFDEVAMKDVASPLGVLPVITYLNAASFQLAVYARDLRSAGAVVPTSLELAGLRALLDTTGCLSTRLGIDGRVAAVSPDGGAASWVTGEAWLTSGVDVETGRAMPGIEGELGLLLDIAAGRDNPARALRKKKLRIRELPQLMRFAPIVQDVPGLPGGPVLRKAAGFLSIWSK